MYFRGSLNFINSSIFCLQSFFNNQAYEDDAQRLHLKLGSFCTKKRKIKMHKSEDNIEAFDITTISEKKSSTMFSIEITKFQRFSITERQTNWLSVPIRPLESVYIKCLEIMHCIHVHVHHFRL